MYSAAYLLVLFIKDNTYLLTYTRPCRRLAEHKYQV